LESTVDIYGRTPQAYLPVVILDCLVSVVSLDGQQEPAEGHVVDAEPR
jgi:hypothetical protein